MKKAMEIIQTKHGEHLKQEAVEEYKTFIFWSYLSIKPLVNNTKDHSISKHISSTGKDLGNCQHRIIQYFGNWRTNEQYHW